MDLNFFRYLMIIAFKALIATFFVKKVIRLAFSGLKKVFVIIFSNKTFQKITPQFLFDLVVFLRIFVQTVAKVIRTRLGLESSPLKTLLVEFLYFFIIFLFCLYYIDKYFYL